MIVGLDVGGTHIDGVIIKDKKIIKTVKNPTQREDLFFPVWTTLEDLMVGIKQADISRINLSTTISTNAIVENKMQPVGMIIQTGPGLPGDFLACGDENLFISGYVDHRGKVVRELDQAEILAGISSFKKKGITACAAVTKFSPRNPSHELSIKEFLQQDFPTITLGHQLSGKLNFPRRVFTAYLNSAVSEAFKTFAQSLKKALIKKGITAPLFILKADGGTMNMEMAEKQPVETILSGPAASLMGLNALLPGTQDAVLMDIGGTTTDFFFLAEGAPLFEPLGIKIGGYKTLVRSVYSHSIGLGGDSSITIEKGKIKIGPLRAGEPVALGGLEPTPTDAMIALGKVDMGDRNKSIKAMEKLGKGLDLTVKEMATEILAGMAEIIKKEIDILLQEINSKPVYTIQELLYGKKIIPQEIGLIGGPAKSLAPILKEKLNMPCYYPEHFSVANAIGAALAKVTAEVTLLADTELGRLSVSEMASYEKINKDYTLDEGIKKAGQLLQKRALFLGEKEKIEIDIIEAESFNMVRGFSAGGKNLRVRAQIKPGLLHFLGGGEDDKS